MLEGGGWQRSIDCRLNLWFEKSYQHGTEISRKGTSWPKCYASDFRIHDKLSMQANKQASRHTHVCSHASVVFETDSTRSAVKIRLVQLFLHY